MTTENRKSTKRAIRWNTADQLDTIQKAVDQINLKGGPGQRATFNNLVADASYEFAQLVLKDANKRTRPLEGIVPRRPRPR